MELSVISDTVVATTQSLGFQAGKLLFRCHSSTSNSNNVSVLRSKVWFLSVICDSSSPEAISGRILAISAGILPVDAMAPPPLKSDSYRVAPRTLARRIKRAPRRLLMGEGENDSNDGSAGNNDGPFGGGSGGWNFNRDEWFSFDESSSSDPAFDFVYEVICWIALSNCLHFAFKKFVRSLGNGVEDTAREKITNFGRCTL